jgi:hypothetical protein
LFSFFKASTSIDSNPIFSAWNCILQCKTLTQQKYPKPQTQKSLPSKLNESYEKHIQTRKLSIGFSMTSLFVDFIKTIDCLLFLFVDSAWPYLLSLQMQNWENLKSL